MILFAVILLLVLSMMLFPFLLAYVSLDRTKGTSLFIKDDNVRDPRYFPKAFRSMMDQALASYDGSGKIRLSKPERLVEPPLPQGTVSGVVLARRDLVLWEPLVFQKELYCMGDGRFPPETIMRAVACRGALTLMENCSVTRWADGEQVLEARSGCELGVSATSAHSLHVEPGCTFRRLYAPEIHIGSADAAYVPLDHEDLPRRRETHRGLNRLEDGEALEGDVISLDDFVVGEGAVLNGSLKTRRRVHLKRGARILGNLIADGAIVMEGDVLICGIVFSQDSIYMGPGCQAGRMGRIKSVVARGSVTLAEGSILFGFVSGEHPGRTVTGEDYYGLIGDQY